MTDREAAARAENKRFHNLIMAALTSQPMTPEFAARFGIGDRGRCWWPVRLRAGSIGARSQCRAIVGGEMSESKFTPGPWRIYHSAWEPWSGAIAVGPNQSDVLFWSTCGGNEEANARLIAAAPDLLEVLQAILYFVPGDLWAREDARAAIAKATRAESFMIESFEPVEQAVLAGWDAERNAYEARLRAANLIIADLTGAVAIAMSALREADDIVSRNRSEALSLVQRAMTKIELNHAYPVATHKR